MSITFDRAKSFNHPENPSLRKTDYLFKKVLYKNEKIVVYEVFPKEKQVDHNKTEVWSHSTVIRMTKLSTKEEDEVKKFFILNNTRLSINYDECPDLVRFYCQGLTRYGDDSYHLVLYDNPLRTFGHFIDVDHEGTEISLLDCFRLIRGALSAFAYLDTNRYILTQFDENNLYVGSFAEDRRALFKVLFKGYYDRNHPNVFFKTKHRFSPPEVGSNDVYKSHCYTLGLMVLYAVIKTYNQEGLEDFTIQNAGNTANVKTRINTTVELLFAKKKKKKSFKVLQKVKQLIFSKKVKDKNLMKNSFKDLLEDLLEPNLEKRKNVKDILKSKFLSEYDIIDYQDYVKEFKGEHIIDDIAEKKP